MTNKLPDYATFQLDALQTRAMSLCEALIVYATHRDTCGRWCSDMSPIYGLPYRWLADDAECTCGLDSLIEQARKAFGAESEGMP